ncbi:MAG: 30S ribosome-binding factor RbfA [Trueperaceae bacterium]
MDKSKYEHNLQRYLSELIATLKDPRIPMIVTVEEVHLSKDGKHAKVLVSTLEPEDIEGMLIALNRAAGYLQHEIADVLELRFTPRLSFYGERLDVLS